MLKPILISFLLFLFFASSANAETKVFYPKQVNINLGSFSENSVTINGYYQLLNNDNNQSYLIKPSSVLHFSFHNGVLMSSNDLNMSSNSGFSIQELTGDDTLVSLIENTPVFSSPETTSEIKKHSFYGEVFIFKSSSNEWTEIRWGDQSGWVLSSFIENTTFAPSVSLFKTTRQYRGSLDVSILNNTLRFTNLLDIEDYLKGVVPNEMPASWHSEALKAQTVAARSYALRSSSLGTSPSSQVYKGYDFEHSRSNLAVDATKGEVVRYGDKIVQTFFFSSSGGRTANIHDMWFSRQTPYYSSVIDEYEQSPHTNWIDEFHPSTILQSFDLPLDTEIYNISLSKTGFNGEVSAVNLSTSIGEKTISGNEMTVRKIFPVSKYYGMLRSNWFDITIKQPFLIQKTNSVQKQLNLPSPQIQMVDGSVVTLNQNLVNVQTKESQIPFETNPLTISLNGKGWGHRIGMSQYGAKGYAENGWDYKQILTHYYQGTIVVQE